MAWRNGAAAAAGGNHPSALLWLERAARIAPDDPRIALDLANIRLGLGGREHTALAAAAFEALAARYDVAAAWLGIIAARRLAGAHGAAAAALAQYLARHCVPEDWGFSELALAVANAAG
jgi:cytochrome c-type biogenesis protein CcmH/NrfG